MKKILVIVLLLWVSSVYAQEQKKTEGGFKFSGQAYAYGLSMQTTIKDDIYSFSGLRFRPYFGYYSSTVETVLKLEIDQIFGGPSQYDSSGKGNKGFADIGYDEKSNIKIKSAYVMLKVPAVKGLSLKGGIDEYKTPGSLLLGTEVPHFLLNYSNDMISANLLYFKTFEGVSVNNPKDENDIYGLDVTVKAGDIKIRPALFLYILNVNGYNYISNSQTLLDKKAYYIVPNLGINAKFGSLAIDFAGVYGSGTAHYVGYDIKASGFAADLSVNYEVMKGIKVGVFGTLLSGDKTDTNQTESFSFFQMKFDGNGRMIILEDQSVYNNQSYNRETNDIRNSKDVNKTSAGYWLAGLSALAKMDAFEAKINVAYASLQRVASGKEKGVGIETDVTLSYEVEKDAKIIGELAYLAAGKAFGLSADNAVIANKIKGDAIYAALGMNIKF